jgi:hypothetical protein
MLIFTAEYSSAGKRTQISPAEEFHAEKRTQKIWKQESESRFSGLQLILFAGKQRKATNRL